MNPENLLVDFSSANQLQFLYNCTKRAYFPVYVQVCHILNASHDVIPEPQLLSSTNYEFLHNLNDQNVIHVTIHQKGQVFPMKPVILTFNNLFYQLKLPT